MEAHLVHTNAVGDTAVVGVLYQIGRRPNSLLETILLHAPEASGAEGPPIGEANPADLFSDLEGARGNRHQVYVDSFYAYRGSLTTPGCTENIRWSVLSDGGHVSHPAVARFHNVISKFDAYGGYANNNRPVQPINERVIGFRCDAKRDHH